MSSEPRASTGHCLCGAVGWRIRPPYMGMTHCHCSMCRKSHAAAFATYITVAAENHELVSGAEAIADYRSSPTFHRSFCRRCGSLVAAHSDGQEVFLPAGLLDDDPGIRPSAHIFAASKAPWHTIADDLPQYATYSFGSGPVIERPGPGAPRDGVLGGSCLCGGVAFEVTAPIRAVYNCHCSRCRRARAAAHTTNGFTGADGLRFRKGEELVDSYKVPEARFFRHSFCRVCGSGMPRSDGERNIAVIPFGALDDDPGRGADRHIFTAYRAPWYTIADDLPQSPEGPPRA